MLHAPHLPAPHGFTTRFGGVSGGVYAAPGGGGLNLDDRAIGGVQDGPAQVAENRRRALAALGFAPDQLSLLSQVHGVDVVVARPGEIQTADAQVSDRPGVALGILTADCYPLLLCDAEAGVVGAAHAGWKGTLGRVAERTVNAMQRLGARPERIRAAVGPGISAERYAVGPEVPGQFEAAGLGSHLRSGQPDLVHLDLATANRQVLEEAGVPGGQIWLSGRCTFGADFYSHRRDAGRTGRMLALIGVRA
ncbi:peptidoglycan editing factor PgeF [Deinococcus irradiatisoli]|nr:peptidoglycan editing factor PgeF [Deinococcus irradiatisoli]